MKALFFVDTHGDERRHAEILKKARMADLIVCAGDFTIFENDMAQILRIFNNIGKPVLIMHGNHETASGIMAECTNLRNIHFIHKTFYIQDDVAFLGYGGGGFSSKDERFREAMEQALREIDVLSKSSNRHYKIVLVTHAPPFGTRLDDLGCHVGNQSITEFILKHQPMLAVSGHLHETADQEDRINNTQLINPGWKGKIMEL